MNQFFKYRAPVQKQDAYALQHQLAERLSKANYGVRDAWRRLPKWQERWLVSFYQDWFDAIESLNAMFNQTGESSNDAVSE